MTVVLGERVLKPVGILTDLLSPTFPVLIAIDIAGTVLGFNDEDAIARDDEMVYLSRSV